MLHLQHHTTACTVVHRSCVAQQRALGRHGRVVLTHSPPRVQEVAVLESREVRIAAAEEAALQASEELARASATQRRDGEAAVRRLQVELQHALELERARVTEEESAVAAAEAACAAAREQGEASRYSLRAWREADSCSVEQQVCCLPPAGRRPSAPTSAGCSAHIGRLQHLHEWIARTSFQRL